MYCKYCGKQIDDDSLFCIHCGRNIASASNGGSFAIKEFHIPKIELKTKIPNIDKSKLSVYFNKIKIVLVLLWKISLTICLGLGGIIAYIALYFIWAPAAALFGVDYPDIGLSEQISNIWRKNKN